jgi:xanthine dehydrogenase accessory factor
MNSTDINVLRQARDWLDQSQCLWLVTVVKTYGSSPRQPGAMLVLREDGVLQGSVSGGCIEDDLIDKVHQGELDKKATSRLVYGQSADERERFRLPCGGTLELLVEPLHSAEWINPVLDHIEQQRLIKRCVKLQDASSELKQALSHEPRISTLQDEVSMIYGPRWRMLIIGAGETSAYLAQMALTLDYQVLVCDPREEMQQAWQQPDTQLLAMMPDDAVTAIQPDLNTAIVALTHDPKLDDMALLEALKTGAFYVGALGSKANNDKRRQRLAMFDLTEAEIARLHGPVGLAIGSKTPAEIAVAILAELIAERHQREQTITSSQQATLV